MHKYLVIFVLLAFVCAATHAQLTFTTRWSKRTPTGPVSCWNDEAVAAIYKMIQSEAEKFLLCQKS